MQMYLKLIILISLFTSLSTSVRPQSYFNELDALHAGQADVLSVTEQNGKFFSIVSVLDSNYVTDSGAHRGNMGYRFVVRNDKGEIIYNTYYEAPNTSATDTLTRTIVKRFDNTFLIICSTIDSGNSVTSLITYDSSGNILKTSKFNKPYLANRPDNGLASVDAREDLFGNVLILSDCMIDLWDGKKAGALILTKLDRNLNVVWHKRYSDDYHSSNGASLLVDSSGYTFSSTLSNSNRLWFDITSQAEIFRVDTSGNQVWYWRSTADSLVSVENLIRCRDGGYVLSGSGFGYQELSQSGTFTTLYFKGWMEKLDSNGNVLWKNDLNTKFLNSVWDNAQVSLVEQADGSFVVGGNILDYFSLTDTTEPWKRVYGLLTKMSGTGKIIWQRKYVSNVDSLSYHVRNMIPTSDNGFLLAGFGEDIYPPEWASFKAWTIKVDSNGCTGKDDPICFQPDTPSQTTYYMVLPNPSSGNFQFRYHKETDQEQMLLVFDVTGRLILERVLADSSGQIPLKLESFPAAIYLYRVMENRQQKAHGKMLKL